MIAKSIPPAIWKAGTVMPKKAKIAPPAAANTASTAARRRHGPHGRPRRPAERPPVIATKIGAAEIGLITEKSDEKASSANCALLRGQHRELALPEGRRRIGSRALQFRDAAA